MEQLPKSLARAFDAFEAALSNVAKAGEYLVASQPEKDDEPQKKAKTDINKALLVSSLYLALKRVRGQENEDAKTEFEKCLKASERINSTGSSQATAKSPQPSTTTTTTSNDSIQNATSSAARSRPNANAPKPNSAKRSHHDHSHSNKKRKS